jgi:hypothetical protein
MLIIFIIHALFSLYALWRLLLLAIYHLNVKNVSKDAGVSGHSGSSSAKFDYVLRQNKYAHDSDEVLFSMSENMPSWAENPRDYWSKADETERKNGRLCKYVEFAIPIELSREEQFKLAEDFARQISTTTTGEKLPFSLAFHRGRGDNNPHCHLMINERCDDGVKRDKEVWFKRFNSKDPMKGGAKKTEELHSRQWIFDIRKTWSEMANSALEKNNITAKIDHRTLKGQGDFHNEAQKHLGPAAAAVIRKNDKELLSERKIQNLEINELIAEQREVAKQIEEKAKFATAQRIEAESEFEKSDHQAEEARISFVEYVIKNSPDPSNFRDYYTREDLRDTIAKQSLTKRVFSGLANKKLIRLNDEYHDLKDIAKKTASIVNALSAQEGEVNNKVLEVKETMFARIPDDDIRRANHTDPTPYLKAKGFTVVREGKHMSVNLGKDELYRITLKDDGRYISCDHYGNGIGDNISLIREIEPGIIFPKAVYSLADRTTLREYKPSLPPPRELPKLPPAANQSACIEYLKGRGISEQTINKAIEQKLLATSKEGILFVGYDINKTPQNVSFRAINETSKVIKRDLKGSSKIYPAFYHGQLPTDGHKNNLIIVEGGIDCLAAVDLALRAGKPEPTVLITGGANVRHFLDATTPKALFSRNFITYADNIFVYGDNEKDNDTQISMDEAHNKQVEYIRQNGGRTARYLKIDVKYGKDLADYNKYLLNEERERIKIDKEKERMAIEEQDAKLDSQRREWCENYVANNQQTNSFVQLAENVQKTLDVPSFCRKLYKLYREEEKEIVFCFKGKESTPELILSKDKVHVIKTDKEAILNMLKVAMERWPDQKIRINGSDDFKAAVFVEAKENKLNIDFTEDSRPKPKQQKEMEKSRSSKPGWGMER